MKPHTLRGTRPAALSPEPAPNPNPGYHTDLPVPPKPHQPVVAFFHAETPDSAVAQEVAHLLPALERRGIAVHRFSLHASVDSTIDAFRRIFPGPIFPDALVGLELAAVPVLQTLREQTGREFLLSLHALPQPFDADLDQGSTILVHDQTTSERLRGRGARIVEAVKPFPIPLFTGLDDPGRIKARYHIGPVDPTILFVGCVDEAHGPDILMRSVPAIVKNHPAARFVFVGDGDGLWPLRVHARYLLLEPVVRLLGHLEGPPVHELIQAADIVVVPSRTPTETWPILAAWAARRPLVASHTMAAGGFLEHERDAILVYPHESSLVWGVERLLFDADLGKRLLQRGHEKLEERHGWNSAALQLESLLRLDIPR